MWLDWFAPALTPLPWVILSTLAFYITLVVFARWSGVRSFAEMSTFDIAVTIAVGSLVAATVVSEDPPLIHGLVAVAGLYGLQLFVSRLRVRYRFVEAATDNAPILLMGAGGELKHANMRVARVTEDDVRGHLRQANVTDLSTVQAMVMEGTGHINVLHGGPGPLPRDSWLLKGVRDYTEAAYSWPDGVPVGRGITLPSKPGS
jgi:uncharacterized membrane protein YcaP (DUF421 family)